LRKYLCRFQDISEYESQNSSQKDQSEKSAEDVEMEKEKPSSISRQNKNIKREVVRPFTQGIPIPPSNPISIVSEKTSSIVRALEKKEKNRPKPKTLSNQTLEILKNSKL